MIKQFAIIENDIVVNTIVVDDSETDMIAAINGIEIPDTVTVNIGYLYANNQFIDPNPPVKTDIFNTQPDLTFEEIEAILQGLIANGA